MTGQQCWPIDNIGPKNEHGRYPVTLVGASARLHFTADELAAAGITPPPDPINFDTLPVGTVLGLGPNELRVKVGDDEWAYVHRESLMRTSTLGKPHLYTVVHVPAPPSKLDALHTLGLTDDDIDWLAGGGYFAPPVAKVVAAAREAQAQR